MIKRAFWLPHCLCILHPSHYLAVQFSGKAAALSPKDKKNKKNKNSWHGAHEWCFHDAYWSLVAPGSRTRSQGRFLNHSAGPTGQHCPAAGVTARPWTHDWEWKFFSFFSDHIILIILKWQHILKRPERPRQRKGNGGVVLKCFVSAVQKIKRERNGL